MYVLVLIITTSRTLTIKKCNITKIKLKTETARVQQQDFYSVYGSKSDMYKSTLYMAARSRSLLHPIIYSEENFLEPWLRNHKGDFVSLPLLGRLGQPVARSERQSCSSSKVFQATSIFKCKSKPKQQIGFLNRGPWYSTARVKRK